MIDRIYFDIETGPAPNAREFCKEPKDKRSKSIEDQLADAALSALTGQVLAVGIIDNGNEPFIFQGPEAGLLTEFWRFYRDSQTTMRSAEWIGFNCHDFDWPFLVQRSYICGVKPAHVCNERGYMRDHLIDLRKLWQCGNKQLGGSLDMIARAMGVGRKTGDGAQFAELYANEATRGQALDYLRNDLALTKCIAGRML